MNTVCSLAFIFALSLKEEEKQRRHKPPSSLTLLNLNRNVNKIFTKRHISHVATAMLWLC